MGRGDRGKSALLEPAAATRGSAPAPARASAQPEQHAEAAAAWDEPGGPEATEEELRQFFAEKKAGLIPEAVAARCMAQLRGEVEEDYALFPTRRSLEAAMAAWQGVSPEQFKADNAHLSWSELVAELQATNPELIHLAHGAESDYIKSHRQLSQSELRRASLRARDVERAKPKPPIPELLLEKVGPGAHSGRLEDYSRSELRKLLGFLERECKHLSDEDLRGMALDGHLLPRFKESPSHAELAWEWARRRRHTIGLQADEFGKALRMPYEKLAWRLGHDDSANRPLKEVAEELGKKHRFLASDLRRRTTARSVDEERLHELAERNGVAIKRPESSHNRVAEGAMQSLMTPLELSYNQAFIDFADKFGGTRKPLRVRENLKDRLGRTHRGCVAYYSPSSGEINLSSAYAKELRKKNPDPSAVARTVTTMAHELFHAVEGEDGGSREAGGRKEHTPQHSIDEGGTEALARLHGQDLAEGMGLWRSEWGEMRKATHRAAYRGEVETTVALAALCCGELDKERLRAGGYTEPEVLSPRARDWLRDLHVKYGPDTRIAMLSEQLQAQGGWEDDGAAARKRVCGLLTECKSSAWQRRARVVPDEDEGTYYEHLDKAGRPLGERLAELLEENGL